MADPDASLSALVERLLVRDRDAHAAAVEELGRRGDERVVPHLVELVVVDAIANDWDRFGFPEVLREHSPPRYLELPEVAWPGVADALVAGAARLPRVPGRHGLWVAFRSLYDRATVLD